jgi:excisionase family DNA binding protein
MEVDIKDWPTGGEAAVQLEVPESRIASLVKQRRLKKRIRRNTGVPVVVIDPDSIAKYRQGPGDLTGEGRANPQTSVALARVDRAGVAPARSGSASTALEAAFLAFLQSKTPSSLVPVERRIFLTMAESAEFSGLPVAFLRRLIASGKLKALKTGAGWRVARLELETSLGALTDTPEGPGEHELRDMEANRRRRQGIAKR